MGSDNLMSKIRHWDNRFAKWFMNHFYFMFFQGILILIFVVWFINTLHVINVSDYVGRFEIEQRIQMTQTVGIAIITILFLLNSFWFLFVFNSIQRMTIILKDIHYALLSIRNQGRDNRRDNPR